MSDERDAAVAYLVGTQALAGITVTREEAEAVVDQAYSEPLIELAERQPVMAEEDAEYGPDPAPTFDAWLAEVEAAHRECVCDVTPIFRHCLVCPTEHGWPCYVRRLVDGYQERGND